MATIEKLDLDTLRELQRIGANAIRKAVEESGLKVSLAGGKLDGEHTARLTFRFIVGDAQHVVFNATAEAKANFESRAGTYGLNKEDWGTTFKILGEGYKVYDIKANNWKKPVIALRDYDSKRFKFPADLVKRKLAK
jgi:hypothetical protein